MENILKLEKVINKSKKFKNKNGKEVPSSFYSLVVYDLEGHSKASVIVKPINNEGYATLDLVSDIKIVGE